SESDWLRYASVIQLKVSAKRSPDFRRSRARFSGLAAVTKKSGSRGEPTLKNRSDFQSDRYEMSLADNGNIAICQARARPPGRIWRKEMANPSFRFRAYCWFPPAG